MALYAFDGTKDRWDKQSPITPTAKTRSGRYFTNVVLFYDAYRNSGLPANYFAGVGSSQRRLDRFFGGYFGVGASGIIRRAFACLRANIESGDRVIDIVGFSRGAAIARAFADMTYKHYPKIVDKTGQPLGEPPQIRFLGLFDTVASFGNPLNDYEWFFQERIPPSVEVTIHAMALDVKRRGFGLDRAYGKNILEVWFRGGHGDIGGNAQLKNDVPNRPRTNITLAFMLKKAIAAGVPLQVDFGQYPTDIKAPIALDNNIEQDLSRQYLKYDVFHHSLFDKAGEVVTFPDAVEVPPRRQIVVEEPENEVQLSEQRLIQLTPKLAMKYPDTRAIYQKLHE